MSYLALYRRFRPTTFDGMVGQEHIVKTLVSQIENDKIGHAYLFCGTRGTGKTSTAKIFSKAINCLSPVNGSPCGKCEVCKALADSSNLDIMEIDAASNNGVNEIRELREKITYPPVSCRYKVYIIDEVHMLTTAAFNALLKTLEEPPKHAVFILATTESHKLPQTILSRCMRFDFKLIPTERIASLIKSVFDEIGKKYEEEAVMQIAKAGEGSIRDALSIADICVSYSKVLTYNDVVEVLGSSNKESIFELIKALLSSDAGKVLDAVNSLASLGKSMGLLNRDLVSGLRDLLVVKTCKNPNAVLCLPKEKLEFLRGIADSTSENRLLRCLEIFGTVESDLRYSTHPRVVFETALIKATRPETDYNIDALMARVKELEKMVASGNITVTTIAQPVQETTTATVETAIKTTPKTVTAHTEKEILGTLIKRLRENNELMLWAIMQRLSAELDGNVFTIITKNDNDKKIIESEENIATITKLLTDFGELKVKVKAITSSQDEEDFAKSVEELKRLVGDDIVIIKD